MKYLELRQRRQEESGDNGTKMVCITFNFPQNSTLARIAWETGVYGMILKWVVKERGEGT